MSSDYCPSRHRTVRRLTRVVNVGGVGVGGNNPIRVQSMTTSDTEDVAATVAQAMALNPRRLEVAPSKLNIRSAEFPPLIVPGEDEVEPAG